MSEAPDDMTRIIRAIEDGDVKAADKLLPLVYDELRRLARLRLRNERSDHTLQATALVHEAYIRLVDVEKAQHWNSRGHFFGAAAEAMRWILVESARRKMRKSRESSPDQFELEEFSPIDEFDHDDLLDLNEALKRFSQIDPQAAELVKLRVFCGLSNDETAAIQNLPPSTAKKHWMYARSWLRRKIASDQSQ